MYLCSIPVILIAAPLVGMLGWVMRPQHPDDRWIDLAQHDIDDPGVDVDILRRQECDHGVRFEDTTATSLMKPADIRRFYPRLDGDCPLGCGYHGIAYASHIHFVSGDW